MTTLSKPFPLGETPKSFHQVALTALLASNPDKARATLQRIIDSLPGELENYNMGSREIAAIMVESLGPGEYDDTARLEELRRATS